MAYYRVYFLDVNGKILSAEDIESASDDSAIALSRELFAQRTQYPIYELWQRARLIHKERR